jgi:hypothetical protein
MLAVLGGGGLGWLTAPSVIFQGPVKYSRYQTYAPGFAHFFDALICSSASPCEADLRLKKSQKYSVEIFEN